MLAMVMSVFEESSSGLAADLTGEILPPVQPATTPAVIPHAPVIPPTPPPPSGDVPKDVLAWDAEQKEATVEMGDSDQNGHFTFNLTNVSSADVTILNVATSCGCTTAHLPPMPWKLDPGATGEISINMNVAGKSGTVIKTVTVHTDKGNKTLQVKSTIVQPSSTGAAMGERERNQQVALSDSQAIFKGDCARCHVEPGMGKMGKELFTAVCGVCHEAEHRASMVADLHAPKQETGRELWRVWVTYGKPGTLMPPFATALGGPLNEKQIDSLIDYMAENLPTKPVETKPTASN